MNQKATPKKAAASTPAAAGASASAPSAESGASTSAPPTATAVDQANTTAASDSGDQGGNAAGAGDTSTVLLASTVSDRIFPDLQEVDRGQGQSDPEEDLEQPYQVASVAIRHNGELYQVGSTVHLNDADADRLGPLVIPTAGETDED